MSKRINFTYDTTAYTFFEQKKKNKIYFPSYRERVFFLNRATESRELFSLRRKIERSRQQANNLINKNLHEI